MFRILASLRSKKRLLKEFVVRDLKARYVGSSMGFFWSVVFPIINLFVYMFVFRLVLKARWSDTMGAFEVSLLMLSGIIVWVAFAETLSRSTNTLVENANLIQKVVFPSEILPAFLSISSLINMCIGLPVILIGTLYFAHVYKPVGHWLHPIGHRADKIYEANGDCHPVPENLESYELCMRITQATQHDAVFPFELSGTATLGEDYRLDTTPLVIKGGEVDAHLVVTILQDDVADDGEDIILTMKEPSGAAQLPPEGEGLPVFRLLIRDAEPGAEIIPAATPRKRLVIGWGADFYQPMKLGVPLVLLPLLIVLQMIFSTGLGYLLATINLYLRDVYHLIGVALTVWMFGTPIFYPGHMVQREGFGLLLQLNPMYWLINSYRRVLLYGHWPDWEFVLRFGIVAVIVFFVGSTLFQRNKPHFPDLL